MNKHAEAKDVLEASFKARAAAKHAKKIEDFLKAAEVAQSPEGLKLKAKEFLIKSNAMKEDDWVL